VKKRNLFSQVDGTKLLRSFLHLVGLGECHHVCGLASDEENNSFMLIFFDKNLMKKT